MSAREIELPKISRDMELILRQRKAGEVDDALFHVYLADQTSRNLLENRAKKYPDYPYPVAQYVSQRIGGAERDPVSHKQVAEFVMRCVRVREENKSALATLHWARRTLEKVGLVDRVQILDNAIAEFPAYAVPPKEYQNAVQVLEMDGEAAASTRGR